MWPRFRAKLAALAMWNDPPQRIYERAFGTDTLQVLFLATPGERRRDQLLTWCEQALTALNRAQDAELFLFSALSPARATVEEIFFDPVWYSPFTGGVRSLFSGGGERR